MCDIKDARQIVTVMVDTQMVDWVKNYACLLSLKLVEARSGAVVDPLSVEYVATV